MIVAGLTGGLASGKSFIAAAMRELGAHTIEADELGHEALAPSGAAYQPVIDQFGSAILAPDGSIDRQKLAAIVFTDPLRLKTLQGIVHPAVRARALQMFREIGESYNSAVVIYAAAILIETGAARDFDKLIVATCPPGQQIERALARGMTPAAVAARMERQLPLHEKVRFADYAIDTGGTTEETLRQTKMVYNELRSLAR